MRLVRHYDVDERETDGAVLWNTMTPKLLKAFEDKVARKFSDKEWLQHIDEGSNKTRSENSESSKHSLVYIRAIQGHIGRTVKLPEMMGDVAIPYNWREFVFHRGCSFNINYDSLLEEEKARGEDKPSSSHLSTLQGTIQMKKHPMTVHQYQGRCTTTAIGNIPKMLFIR